MNFINTKNSRNKINEIWTKKLNFKIIFFRGFYHNTKYSAKFNTFSIIPHFIFFDKFYFYFIETKISYKKL